MDSSLFVFKAWGSYESQGFNHMDFMDCWFEIVGGNVYLISRDVKNILLY